MASSILHAHIPGLIQTIQALCILNIPLCLAVIVAVLYYARKHDMRTQVSFRLSASIAVADIIYSVVQLVLNSEQYTDSLSVMHIRFLFFLHLASVNAVIFNTFCIALNMTLTLLVDRRVLARKLSPWYELFAWLAAVAIGHPIFYLYKHMSKVHGLNIIIASDDSMGKIRTFVWLMYCWCAAALLYCVVVCVLVILRLAMMVGRKSKAGTLRCTEGRANYACFSDATTPVLSAAKLASPLLLSSSSALEAALTPGGSTATVGATRHGRALGNVNDEAGAPHYRRIEYRTRRDVHFAVIRIALYMVAPLVSTPIMPVYLSIEHPSVSIVNVVIVLPCLGGLINFVIFAIHPLLDSFWKRCYQSARQFCGCAWRRLTGTNPTAS